MTHLWRTLSPDTCCSVSLPALGHLPAHEHLFTPRDVWAIKAALGARRPLLVRGEPGTGKSELARAAAAALGWAYVAEVVTARTEPSDLHWRFDAVARLAQAQLHGAGSGAAGGAASGVAGGAAGREGGPMAEWRYVSPGALWWVFDRPGAEKQWHVASSKGSRPAPPPPRVGSRMPITARCCSSTRSIKPIPTCPMGFWRAWAMVSSECRTWTSRCVVVGPRRRR